MRRRGSAILAALFYAASPTLAAADIVVGVALPASGPQAALAQSMRRAAELAADHLNDKGGVLGQRIVLTDADDGCNAEHAETAAGELAEREVALVVGHPCASAAISASRIYGKSGILFIAPATRHPGLTSTRAGSTIFRLAGRDDRQGWTAGAYLAEKFKGKRIALVHDRTRYANRLAEEVSLALKAVGMSDVMTATIVAASKDYGALVASLKLARIDAVYFAGFPIEAAQILRQMRSTGLAAVFIGSETLATPEFVSLAGADIAGVRLSLPYDRSPDAPAARLVEVLKKEGLVATDVAIGTYAAIEAWAAAATAAQSISPKVVAETLTTRTFDTVAGPVVFDRSGDARGPSYAIVAWRDGNWVREP